MKLIILSTAVVALFSTQAFTASVFNQHSLQKRQAPEDELVGESLEQELTLEERVQLVETVINQTDPKQCYPRLLCEMASSDTGYDHFRYLLGTFGGSMDEELKKLPQGLQDFSAKLRSYIDTGKSLGDVEECRKTYGCEFTGVQIEEHTAYLEKQIVALLPNEAQGEEILIEEVQE